MSFVLTILLFVLAGPTTEPSTSPVPIKIEGKSVTIDVTQSPDLETWAHDKLLPVCDEWYPKIVAMLPSEGFQSRGHVLVQFRTKMPPGVPAYASGGKIVCSIDWFRKNLDGEARGAVVHEMVHIVQSYGDPKRTNPTADDNPGWLVEGLADYIRWYLYEPESHGTNIRDPAKAKYDASYRVTANFLNWVVEHHDKDIIKQLNAAMRDGRYSEELWKEYTGKPVQELGEEWKASLKH
jgi:hypothetical protein